MRFVIVDDEEINLFLSKRLLTVLSGVKEIHTFQNGGEALRFLQCYRGDETISVFLDLNMPVVSGWDFLDFFNRFDDSLKSRVHIYVVTSSIDPEDKIRVLGNPNVISFVSKPLTPAFIKDNFCNT